MAFIDTLITTVTALVLNAKLNDRLHYNDKSGEFSLSHEDKCRFIVSVIGLHHNAGFVIFTPKGLDFLEKVEDSHSMREIRNIVINNGGGLFLESIGRLFSRGFSYFEVSQDSEEFCSDIGRVLVNFGNILRDVDNGTNEFVSDASDWFDIIALGQKLND